MEEKLRPTAFVIMPFERASTIREDSKWQQSVLNKDNLDTIYEMIRSSLEPNFSVSRSAGPGNIVQQIILNLHKAALVVADLTGLNPNVMYELGVRHSFPRKKTLLITQDLRELPFDLGGFFCVEYKWVNQSDKLDFRRKTLEQIDLMNKGDHVVCSPVETYIEISDYSISLYEKRIVLRRLDALQKELNALLYALIGAVASCIPDVFQKLELDSTWIVVRLDEVKKRDDSTSIDQRNLNEAVERMRHVIVGLNLFLAENYIPEGVVTSEERDHLLSFANVLRGLINLPVQGTLVRGLMTSWVCSYFVRDFDLIVARLKDNALAYNADLWVSSIEAHEIPSLAELHFPKATAELFSIVRERNNKK